MQAESCSLPNQLTEGQLHLAQANQIFHASNLLALGLRFFQPTGYLHKHTSNFESSETTMLIETLSESFEQFLMQLTPFQLNHWPITHSCFVYLNALWAYVDRDELTIEPSK